jgi:hypothetical protein
MKPLLPTLDQRTLSHSYNLRILNTDGMRSRLSVLFSCIGRFFLDPLICRSGADGLQYTGVARTVRRPIGGTEDHQRGQRGPEHEIWVS